MKRTLAAVRHNGQVVILEEDIPELGENEALVKVRVSLISPGTEMNLIRQRRSQPAPEGSPMPFGYSIGGDIAAVKGNAGGLAAGMRVAGMGGGARHATHAIVPVNLLVPLPDGVTYEDGAYLSLAATSLQAVRRTEPLLGEYGVVAGLGIVGAFAAQIYRLCGARVMGQDMIIMRREIARVCGIEDTVDPGCPAMTDQARMFSAPYGLDFACFAFAGSADAAYAALRPAMKISQDGHEMGRIVLVGGCMISLWGGAANGNLDFRVSSRTGPGYHDAAWEHGSNYPMGFVPFTTQRNARELARLMAEKRLLAAPMTTHRLPLDEAGKAADLLLEHPDQALGVILEMPG